MLHFIRATDLHTQPKLADGMFRDRGRQFHERLRWEVSIDAKGHERDCYDTLDPLYVIWEMPDGQHGGSMRFLPTTGRTMTEEHFLSLTDGVAIRSPHIWECTRFCLAPGADPQVSAALMLGGLELGLASGWSHALGVFDARMVRVYRRLGWGPIILGTQGTGRDAISVGLWAFEEDRREALRAKATVSDADIARNAVRIPALT